MLSCGQISLQIKMVHKMMTHKKQLDMNNKNASCSLQVFVSCFSYAFSTFFTRQIFLRLMLTDK